MRRQQAVELLKVGFGLGVRNPSVQQDGRQLVADVDDSLYLVLLDLRSELLQPFDHIAVALELAFASQLPGAIEIKDLVPAPLDA